MADTRKTAKVYLGVVDGKKKYKTFHAETKSAAQKMANKFRADMERGIDVGAEKDTFLYWCKKYLIIQKSRVSESWYRNIVGYVNGMTPLHDMPIREIARMDIDEFLTQLASENPKTHKKTAKRTVNGYLSTIKQVMQLAIDNRVMDYNPAASMKPFGAAKEPRRALTSTEQSWIINTPHRAQRAAMIMMYSGLRRGEIIPLTKSDIDLENATVTVSKSVEMVNGVPCVKPYAKTDAGNRVVNIPDVLVEFLQADFAVEKPQNVLVCPAVGGGMMSDTAWRRMWESYLTDLNWKYGARIDKTGKPANSKYNKNGVVMTIPNITAHWLRHTFATLLYLSGVDILTARDQLGHADIKTTLQIYTHLDKIYKRKNISKLNDYLENMA